MKTYNLHQLTTSKDLPFHIEKASLKHDFAEHTHDFSELVLILEGKAVHVIDSMEYSIKAGDVYVIAGDTSHGFKDVSGLKLCNVMFQPDHFFANNADIKKIPGF